MIKELNMSIWGREFILPVEFHCYLGETVTISQQNALKTFTNHPNWLEAAKEQVEKYCYNEVNADKGNQKKDNIFSYIKPECFFVKREETQPRVALMCKYRYDPEHGLAIVFSADGRVVIGSQDIIL